MPKAYQNMLAIDIGNTKTALAVFRGDTIAAKQSLATRTLKADAIAQVCSHLLADTSNDEREAFISSVVPEAVSTAKEGAQRVGARAVHQIETQTTAIIPHRLRAPSAVGVDRLLAARAARDFYAASERKPLIIIQAGTAVTVDAVDAEGCFGGGIILPGPRLWLEGLSLAARIPRFAAEDIDWRILMAPADSWPGQDTREAVLRGLAMGLPAAIGAVGRALAQAVGASQFCLTGGWAENLQPLLPFSAVLAPDLVLHGIRLVAEDIRRDL